MFFNQLREVSIVTEITQYLRNSLKILVYLDVEFLFYFNLVH